MRRQSFFYFFFSYLQASVFISKCLNSANLAHIFYYFDFISKCVMVGHVGIHFTVTLLV